MTLKQLQSMYMSVTTRSYCGVLEYVRNAIYCNLKVVNKHNILYKRKVNGALR